VIAIEIGPRNLSRGVRRTDRRDAGVSDTPIYDQMEWEFRAGRTSTDEPSRSSGQGSRRHDGTRRSVSVWALVDEHRRRT
jgi:hypothetical protein